MERIETVPPADSVGTLVQALPDVVYILDMDGKFLFLNEAARGFGYEPSSLLGWHFTTILHPEDRDRVSREIVVARIRSEGRNPDLAPKFFDERRSGARMTRDLRVRILRGGSGEYIYASVNAYGILNPGDSPGPFKGMKGPVTVGVVRDITDSVRYETSLKENIEAKNFLLQEVHHRVRDNLQLVASLAQLKAREAGREAEKAFGGLVAQIRSLAMVHDALYNSETLKGVVPGEYFSKLAGLLVETFGKMGSFKDVDVRVDPGISLDPDSLSYLGLAAGEFLSAALGTAAPADSGAGLSLYLGRAGGGIQAGSAARWT
ncbi:MAG TPA: histidine kinase dimerization/phosphoacceptor domain -containing protein, partial [Rectinemataceae bacterium]